VRRLRAALSLSTIALLVAALPVLAGNPFSRSTSTVSGEWTWNADMVDAERGVTETGRGVYVAVLDTGLPPNWKDYYPQARIAENLGVGFVQDVSFKAHSDDCGVGVEVGTIRKTSFIGSRSSTHGAHVASIIVGYNYRSNTDLAQGFPLPAVQVRGIAPEATIIPVKVLADYQLPSLPKCPDAASHSQTVNFGTSEAIARGIDYVTSLKRGVLHNHPVVINMSLGGDPTDPLEPVEKNAIDRAIAAGVVVVAAAGNDGEAGMDFPGGYAPVISVGSAGWTAEWLDQPSDDATNTAPANGSRYRMFWLQDRTGDLTPPLHPGSGQVPERTAAGTGAQDVYVSDFSGRENNPGHELDVLAPGSWVRGPYPGFPGYAHLPFWAKGGGDVHGRNPGNFLYVGGTSQATPHVSAIAALLLQQHPSLTPAQVQARIKATALPIPPGSTEVWDIAHVDANGNPLPPAFYEFTWGADATGAGLVQADAALNAP
jgi:subtilisin family serine protease